MTRIASTPKARAALALAAGLAVTAVSLGGAARAADAASLGATLFLQCRACHTVDKGAPAGVGPNLWGVMGAQAGQRPGYAYSGALASSKIVWKPSTMDAWLTQPTALVPGTKMAFQGVASPKARQALIAYLMTLGAEGAPKAGR